MNPAPALVNRLLLLLVALPACLAAACAPDVVPERELAKDAIPTLVDGCTGPARRRCSEYTLRFDPTPIEDPVVLDACLTYAEH